MAAKSLSTCQVCGTSFSALSVSLSTFCPSCGEVVFPSASGPQVLVAHSTAEIRLHTAQVIWAKGFHPLCASDGTLAESVAVKHQVAAAVLDVALRGVLFFELIERLRAHPDLKALPCVLIASVYNKTAYKRTPIDLYGADDYVEQHHIHDMLTDKLSALLGLSGQEVVRTAADQAETSIRPVAVGDLRAEVEAIRAAAYDIAADIALYHQPEIVEAARSRDLAPLSQALAEGRRLLEERLGGSSHRDWIAEAFQRIVDRLG